MAARAMRYAQSPEGKRMIEQTRGASRTAAARARDSPGAQP